MFAINHAATVLLIKKEFLNVPIIWLLISVQFIEIWWPPAAVSFIVMPITMKWAHKIHVLDHETLSRLP